MARYHPVVKRRTQGHLAARAALSAVAIIIAGCGSAEPAPVAPPVIEVDGDPRGHAIAPSEVSEPVPKRDPASCVADLVAARGSAPDGPDADLFTVALSARAAGDKTTARRRLLELTQNHNRSRLVPRAYLLFGEMFAEEAASEPSKWPIAANFYREVLKYPYPENEAFFYAALRLGEAHGRQDDHAHALAESKRVLEGRAKHPDAPCMHTVGHAARRLILVSYAEVGDPQKALMFFKPLAADALDHQLMTIDLAAVYAQAGKVNEARVVVNGLLSPPPRTAACVALARVVAEHALNVTIAPACP